MYGHPRPCGVNDGGEIGNIVDPNILLPPHVMSDVMFVAPKTCPYTVLFAVSQVHIPAITGEDGRLFRYTTLEVAPPVPVAVMVRVVSPNATGTVNDHEVVPLAVPDELVAPVQYQVTDRLLPVADPDTLIGSVPAPVPVQPYSDEGELMVSVVGFHTDPVPETNGALSDAEHVDDLTRFLTEP